MYLDASTIDNRRRKERSWAEVLVHTSGHRREVEEVWNLALDERCDGSDVNLAVVGHVGTSNTTHGHDTAAHLDLNASFLLVPQRAEHAGAVQDTCLEAAVHIHSDKAFVDHLQMVGHTAYTTDERLP